MDTATKRSRIAHTITTVSGERFSAQDSASLAHLIWRRFGRNDLAACEAWRRLLQNDCPLEDFQRLVAEGGR